MADPQDSRERKRAVKRAWYLANRDKSIARVTQWVKDNREQNNATRRARHAAKNPEKPARKDPEARGAYYAANRDKQIASAAKWVKDNRERSRATARARYAANRDKILAEVRAWRANNPEMAAYTTHKHHAKRRGTPFLLTFEEWRLIWHESGKFAERGHCKGQYVMARTGDVGPYAVGNVRITTVSDNHAEAWELKPDRHKHRRRHS